VPVPSPHRERGSTCMSSPLSLTSGHDSLYPPHTARPSRGDMQRPETPHRSDHARVALGTRQPGAVTHHHTAAAKCHGESKEPKRTMPALHSGRGTSFMQACVPGVTLVLTWGRLKRADSKEPSTSPSPPAPPTCVMYVPSSLVTTCKSSPPSGARETHSKLYQVHSLCTACCHFFFFFFLIYLFARSSSAWARGVAGRLTMRWLLESLMKRRSLARSVAIFPGT